MNVKPLLMCVLLPFSVCAEEITFGIVPQQSATTLAKRWGPILRAVSESTGHEIVFRTTKDIPEFEKQLLRGEFDIAYMNPYHYTVFHQTPGYQAFAKQKDKMIRGLIVVQKGSALDNISELNGKTVAFPSPAAFAASVLPKAALEQRGIKVKPMYVSSHDSVYLNVARGVVEAGGGIERTLNNIQPEVREQLSVLWRSEAYTPHAFAYHPNLSIEVVQQIQTALIELADTEEGAMLLKAINFSGIAAAKDEDWDDVRALNITSLEHLMN